MDRDIAIMVNIMMLMSIRFTSSPTPKVSKLGKQIRTGLKKINPKEYNKLETKVRDSWDTARKEVIPKDGKLDSSIGTLIEQLYSSLKFNPYKHSFYTEKTLIACLNSYSGSVNHEADVVAINNSRKLANRFLELIGVEKDNTLSKRVMYLKNELIIEGVIQ